MSKKIVKIIFLGLVLFFVFNSTAFATELGQNTVIIKASTKTPRPGQTVYVELDSAPRIVDLDRSEITWIVNDNVIKKGIGKSRLQIKAGKVGSKYKISAFIRTFDGNFVTKNISIISEEITIIWEADTYTPPFYKGKSLDTQNSTIKLVAFPNIVDKTGRRIPTGDLIYKWSVDGTFVKALSGIGKNVYIIRSETIPVTITVKLAVSSFNKKIEVKTTTRLKKSNPKIIFYEDDPLLGILFNRALEEDIKMDKGEISIAPYPFFFSVDKRTSESLSYTWLVGDRVINTPTKTGGSMTFAKPTKETGRSEATLLLSNLENKYQKIEKFLFFDF